MKQLKIRDYEIKVFDENAEENDPVIWIHTFPGEAEKICAQLKERCVLISVTGNDWNRDFSPWPADRTFASGDNFAGGAAVYLELFVKEIVPKAEFLLSYEVKDRGIAGYSMAGLFASYVMYHTDLFGRAGMMSASFWFDGWKEYALEHNPQKQDTVMYVSLGSREHKVKNRRMSKVKECTEALVQHWREDFNVLYEINPGGHFDRVTERTARGADKLLSL
ncbi:alpha/beta hydrolase [Anaerostipes sp.]|uniref:alpha/beta hydrolase n=1 Tax=Anaerostipes sp. TaxID=1872530 RepID=UPI0025C6C478|nr:alpha/beta hydrolase-fold protein [Anaerostipes sp.]MBS7006818.1 alpha/beta hydrolase [Anaerostipes sp.]